MDVALPLRRRVARVAPWFGPAFVAAIAYADPGNFATNFTGGARFGYRLVWVVVGANLIAMLIQSLSAKLGLITGRDLAELCRENLPRAVSRLLWIQAEVVAMATDLAEIIGGALALNLLFAVPLPIGGLITCVVAFALLALHQRGLRRFETVIGGLLGVILLGFLYDVLRAGTDPAAVASGLVPSFAGSDSVVLATGILGATVMPHVIYLHSALTKSRAEAATDPVARRSALPAGRHAARAGRRRRHQPGHAGHRRPAVLRNRDGRDGQPGRDPPSPGDTLLDHGAALAFAIALLASGLASSSVGTFVGQIVMQGFVGRSIPLPVRRVLTMAPAMVVLTLGADPTAALVWSQVVLSFGVPFALVPLIWLTSRRRIMGDQRNLPITTLAASAVAALIIGLNLLLIVRTVIV